MKITSFADIVRFPDRVQEKTDARDRRDSQHQQQPNSDQQKRRQEPADPQQVDQAMQEFAQDAQAQAHGLTVSASGQGPGLRVVLKDGSGAVLRQFTGEEFLRLREAAHGENRVRGKILDQKF